MDNESINNRVKAFNRYSRVTRDGDDKDSRLMDAMALIMAGVRAKIAADTDCDPEDIDNLTVNGYTIVMINAANEATLRVNAEESEDG